MRARPLLPLILAVLAGLAACRTERETHAVVPYTTQVQPILAAQCLRCHAEAAPAGGFRADGYLGAIGCNGAGTAVTTTADGGAPLLVSVLERADHAAYSSAADRTTIARWVATGTSRSGGGAHPAGFADPRSPDSHASYLRARRYAPLLDAEDVEACATCHGATGNAALDAGAPTATGAPACSSCHQDADVAFSCTTCHGSGTAGGTRAYPPRDPCFFPGDPAGAHAAHAEASAVRQSGLACTTCHPTPAKGDFGGHHANGSTEVWFDYALTGATVYAAGEQRCTGSCHDHGGARPTPAWTEKGPLSCGDCHGAPPAGHYAGTCSTCHAEANADGTALTPGPLHINGKVDRGNGNGTCSACHGQGTSPWPTTGAHAAHANPKDAAPVPCESCHAVPAAGDRHPLGGGVVVRFAGLATTGARRATYDAATKTCAGTYCHESRGGQESTPTWTGTLTTGCTACHAAPPPAPHVQSTTCGGSGCHEGRTDANGLTDLGRAGHVNGNVDRAY